VLKDVIYVEPLDNYCLRIRFEDGVEGVVDISEMTSFKGVFAPLEDKAFFRKVGLNKELGVVVWENGVDLDPDVLYSKITGEPIPKYHVVHAQ